MDPFLVALIAWLAASDIVPPMMTPSDTDLQKSYLYSLPDAPDKVVAFRNYYTNSPSVVPKQVGVKYIQVTFRDVTQKGAFEAVQKLYMFLLQRPEPIDWISDKYYCIFDVRNGPIPLSDDEKGRHRWSLSFPVKTNLY
jgi:hypothetical protein